MQIDATGNQSLDFVSAIDRNYVVPYAVMLASFRQANPAIEASATVLHFDLTDDDATLLKRVGEATGIPVSLIPIPSHPFALFESRRRSSIKARRTMSPIAYAKAFLDRFLPAEMECVVCIDADIVVTGSMADIVGWRIERPLAAVTNLPRMHHHQFNSGFMLIDLKQWREWQVSDVSEKFLIRYSDSLHTHDQHTLNLIFGSCWERLPLAWNYTEDFHRFRERATAFSDAEIDAARAAPIVLHYAVGRDKPWRLKSSHPRAYLYREHRKQLLPLFAGLSLADPQEAGIVD